MKFYNDASTLVAVDEDACAYWSAKDSEWRMGGVGLARDCRFDLNSISKAAAKKQFPNADLSAIPDFTEAKAKAEEGYDRGVGGSKDNDDLVT